MTAPDFVFRIPVDGPRVLVCRKCGSVVFEDEADKHREWHHKFVGDMGKPVKSWAERVADL